jgi:hypothetical protein
LRWLPVIENIQADDQENLKHTVTPFTALLLALLAVR